ncbi:ABC transporter ATP-binding protein [Neisseria weixii]|uniref:ABC transporter ATP-binding protein n=1 Tax=Neisseria weixii TaxID=1853276 RepID=A0A3N4N201_9NEIS|nr:dipeptide ABC transporter ATP-binding protein [Neisseria weixii]RPD90212.1 ABC transporter ATP-binding protein [Neisseria weixii]RPD90355.1 ABC transporter ATP-binding protein [Neisseria weixii]
MMTPILHIENLYASFPGKQVLYDINLTVQAGRKLAVVGESGSGKTVLAQGMMRLNPAVSLTGRLKFEDTDLLTLPERSLQKLRGRDIGMVFQEPMTALNPVMRVGRQIAEVLMLHLGLTAKQAWARAVGLLCETGIRQPEEKALAYPFQLSGGQRQRAMIAMAVAAEPKLLIADEPTTALDVAVQAQILDLLSRLQQARGMTLVYISHDLNLVRRFADDVVVMQHGRIVEQGSVEDVFRRPQHEYTKMLLNAGAVRQVVGLPQNPATVLEGEAISVSVKEQAGWFKKRRKILLQPLDFHLKAGETLGIIGESGSGKTTLAKAVMNLTDAEGRLQINGQAWRPELRREIQMVFQDPFGAFNPRMNVFDIVAEGLRVHEPQLSREAMRERVAETLRQVGLPEDVMTRYPHAFSGGQRQRLAIARAIIVRPKILVLDEPTSALDVQWQQQILALLADLQRQHGLSLIIISHDLAVIRALSHRVMVLKDGQIVEEGDLDAVFANPHAAYTQNLLLHAGA